jgi:polysaccharide biosynthesis transport protein
VTQTEFNLRDVWWIIRRQKWLVISVPLLLAVAAYGFALLRAPVPLFRASAVVSVERAFNVATLLLRDVIRMSPTGDLETQTAVVKGFSVLSRAAQKLGLIPASALLEGPVAPAHQEIVEHLAQQIDVRHDNRTSLIEVVVTSPDPDLAARLANSVAEAFQEHDTESRARQVVEARRFIEAQLDEVGHRLQQSENRLRTFQEANTVLLLQDDVRAAVNRLAEHEVERERLQRDISATELQLRLLDQQATSDGLPSIAAEGGDPTLPRLKGALHDLMLEHETLLLSLRPSHPQVRAVDAKIDNLRRQLTDVITADRARLLDTNTSKLRLLNVHAARLTRVIGDLQARQAALPAVTLDAARLEREVKVDERLFSLLKERLQEVLIKEKEQVAEVSLVKPASVPVAPINPPQPVQQALVALFLGLVVGLVLALIVETLDTSIGAADDIEALLGTAVVGVIPYLNEKAIATEEPDASNRNAFLATLFAGTSSLAEAFRGLRTNILLATLERDVKIIMVTSAAQAEGKTTVAINLAITLAQLGKKTLLVEADLRHPFVRRVFGIIPKLPGLTDVVLGSATLGDATLGFADLMLGKPGMESLLDSPGMDKFFLLPSGHRALNPAELVSSQAMGRLLAEARERFDYVIVDSAPVLSVADTQILAAQMDGILSVVRMGSVPRAGLRRAKVLLDGTKTTLVGVCLNGVTAETSRSYAEMAYYGYGSHPRATKPRSRFRLLQGLRPRRLVEITAAVLTLLALGPVLFAVGRVGMSYLFPRPSAAQVGAQPTSEAEGAGTPAAAPKSAAGPGSYSLELPISAAGAGQVLLGDFSSPAEAAAHGRELVRTGVVTSFRVVATQ